MALAPGLRASIVHTVVDADTAEATGSGDVPVLSTPRALALLEAACVAAVVGELEPGRTSVGTSVVLDHTAPTPVGAELTAEADLVAVEGRTLRFAVRLHDAAEQVAAGTLERVLVDRARFVVGAV